MSNDVRAAKDTLRAAIRRRRKALDLDDRRRWSDAIARAILDATAWKEARDVAAFVGHGGEPDTMPILRETLASGKRLWLPRVIDVDPPSLQWLAVHDLEHLVPGPFHTLEPVPHLGKAPGRTFAMDLVLVPGVAFSSVGTRLGSGLGFFDRALESVRDKDTVIRAGVCFSSFVDPREGEVPCEPHDIPMHALCTELGFRPCDAPGERLA